MDFMAKITELKNQKNGLIANAQKLIDDGKIDEASAVNTEIEKINNSIITIENLAKNSADSAEPTAPTETSPVKNAAPTPFANLGEQLKAIADVKRKGIVDKRLIEINNAVKGSSEGTGTDGGFAVQEDFAGKILETAAQTGQILSRVDKYNVSSSANSARWLQIDETNVSETVFGGVRTYWSSEAATVASSKPLFREMKLELEKMMGFAYATEEMLEDAPFMSSFFGRAFSVAVDRLLESTIISGDGVGKPLGILNSGNLISVAKESNQTADTINTDNLLKMWQRLLYNNRTNCIWLAHPDTEMQFPKLTLGNDNIWMPEKGGLSVSPYQTILGRPIIYDDKCSALGDKGDLILCDLGEYILLKKGTARQDWSMHVEFLTDQMCFRIILRVNGAPKSNKPIRLKNSTFDRSPFVTLNDRA